MPSADNWRKRRLSSVIQELTTRFGGLQRAVKQLHQLLEAAPRVIRVVHFAARDHPAMLCRVHLALIVATPRLKRPLEFLDLLGIHPGIFVSMAEVEMRLHARQNEMRASGVVGEQSGAVK